MNQLKVEKQPEGELEVTVIDGEGVTHDITEAFRQISGATTASGGFTNRIQVQDDVTAITIDFTALGKDMTFDLPEATVRQLVAVAS